MVATLRHEFSQRTSTRNADTPASLSRFCVFVSVLEHDGRELTQPPVDATTSPGLHARLYRWK